MYITDILKAIHNKDYSVVKTFRAASFGVSSSFFSGALPRKQVRGVFIGGRGSGLFMHKFQQRRIVSGIGGTQCIYVTFS